MSDVVIYCPECRTEYREGFTTCSECDVALVRRLDAEVVEQLVPLARETSFELIAELLDQLEKEGIPYVIQAGTALRMLEDRGAEVTEPQPWEARVWVTGARHRIAREIYEELLSERRFEREAQATQRYLDATGNRSE